MPLIANLWRSIENPKFPLSQAADEWFGGLTSSAGVRVNSETALTYSPVWRGVWIISNAVGKLPQYVYQRDDDGEGKHYATKHPAYRLLRRKPNEEMTAFVFRRSVQGIALLEGNGYAFIERRGDGRPNQLIPLLPGTCNPVRSAGALWYLVHAPSGEPRKIPARDMLHIKGPGLDSLLGYKLTEKARHGIGAGMAAQEYSARFFSNGAEPRVVLEHPKVLSPKAKDNIREGWNRAHQGLENSHKVSILEEGMKVAVFGLDPQKSQMIESLKFSVKDVANWLGLPPHLLGDDTRTAYASLEQENLSFLDHSLDPWLVNWEEECYDKLLSEEEKRGEAFTIEFMRLALLRADSAARSMFYHNAMQDGWMNGDEVRSRENLNPMPDGNGKQFYRPLNMVPVGGEQDAEEAKFKRETFGRIQQNPNLANVAANLIDMKDLADDVGLTVNKEYFEPIMPVQAENKPLVSGEVLKNADGEIVGGDIDKASIPAKQISAPPGNGPIAGAGPGKGQPKGGIEGQQQKAEAAGEETRGDEQRMATIRKATRQLLIDATRRMTKRLVARAQKKNGAGEWVEEDRAMIHEAMEPAVIAYAMAGGMEVDPKATVDGFVAGFVGDVTVAGVDFQKVLETYGEKSVEMWVEGIVAEAK